MALLAPREYHGGDNIVDVAAFDAHKSVVHGVFVRSGDCGEFAAS